MTNRNIFAVMAGLVLVAGSVSAQPYGYGGNSPQRGPMPHAMMDTNKDGYVSENELYTFRSQRQAQRASEGRMMRNAGNAPTFEQLDVNKDGVISPDEFNAYRQQRMNQRRMGY